MATPARKNVHFDLNSPSFSDADTSTDSIVSTSSLQYINAQLVAHGFAPSPGLCLDGVSNSNMDRTVKCLLDLLGQRVKDMNRTEELSTELRTLRYDHERLSSMHRSAQEKSANLEREMNVHKSRLAAVDRKRQSAETAHKHTTAELQRTRGLLQALRTAHQNEIKKKEKDMEKFVEKWQRLADAQAKLMNTPSGMYCANSAVVEGTEIIGKGQGFLEIALEQAERARSELSTENLELKRLVLTAVNETQTVLSDAKRILVGKSDELTPFTLTTLFPLVPVGHASEKLYDILGALRNSLSLLMPVSSIPRPSAPTSDGELDKLQSVIDELKKQLGDAQKQASIQTTETQQVLNQFLSDKRLQTGFNAADVSVDLMTTTARDQERDRLDLLRKQLDEERESFTQATIKLGQERVLIEADRLRLKDEKRRWEVEQMLAELPPTPPDASSSSTLSPPKKKSPKKKSPKKAEWTRKSPSPKAVKVGKVGEGKKHRSAVLLSPSKRVEPPYETEFMPFGQPNLTARPLTSSILPTSFVLPPPSPRTSLPSQTALVMSSTFPNPVSLPPLPEPSPVTASSSAISTPQSQTAFYRASKPFGSRMIHAYSPARPSPLSRILMLGNSPNLSGEAGLDPLVEMDEEAEAKNIAADEMFPELPLIEDKDEQLTLAQELGVVESPPESLVRPESLLRDGRAETNRNVLAKTAKGRAVRSSERTKSRVVSDPTGAHRGPAKPLEKENSRRTASTTVAALGKEKSAAVAKPARSVTRSSTIESKTRPATVKLSIPPSTTGPRRVLVGSAEAPRTKT